MGRWAVAGPQPHCSLVQSGGAAHSPELPLPIPDGACEAERMEEPITACSPGRRVAMQAFPKASLHRFPKVFQARRAGQRAGTSAVWKTTYSELSLMWGQAVIFLVGGLLYHI